mmetsp:Transcript_58014/g.104508  ORF Transcript_58014/g.104508 Transcript_58014/m.104508 type:complete len:445 (-) Transcript_58014:189-1523(-)
MMVPQDGGKPVSREVTAGEEQPKVLQEDFSTVHEAQSSEPQESDSGKRATDQSASDHQEVFGTTLAATGSTSPVTSPTGTGASNWCKASTTASAPVVPTVSATAIGWVSPRPVPLFKSPLPTWLPYQISTPRLPRLMARLPNGPPAPLTARESRPPVPSVRVRIPSSECLGAGKDAARSVTPTPARVSQFAEQADTLSHSIQSPARKVRSVPPGEGVHTPPPNPIHMLRSSSSHVSRERQVASPRMSDLGSVVRTDSPFKTPVDGGLISPSPLSSTSRHNRLEFTRNSSVAAPSHPSHASGASSACSSSPMLRQRTLPGNLRQGSPERQISTTVITASALQGLTALNSQRLTGRGSLGRAGRAPELTSDRPPARPVGEALLQSRTESFRRRWRRPSGPGPPPPVSTPAPSASQSMSGESNEFTPAFFRLQEKLSYLAEEGTVSL